jgi:AraC-like DNA-binding protein
MLSNQLHMSRGNLYKKLLAITGVTPINFIRMVRFNHAKHLLAHSQLYVSEIAYAVGFNSPKLFTKYFRETFNMPPSEYAKVYRQNKKIIPITSNMVTTL